MSQQPLIFQPGSPKRVPWLPLMLTGVLVVIVGIGLLVWPFFAATWILALLVGSAFIANGLALLSRGAGAPAALLGAAVLIGLGVLAILIPELTVSAIVAFAGIGLIGIGALWILFTAGIAGGRRPGLIVPGAVLLVGGIVAIIWPMVALTIVAIVGGVFTLLIGGLIIWAARSLRRFGRGRGGGAGGPADSGGDPGAPSRTTIII